MKIVCNRWGFSLSWTFGYQLLPLITSVAYWPRGEIFFYQDHEFTDTSIKSPGLDWCVRKSRVTLWALSRGGDMDSGWWVWPLGSFTDHMRASIVQRSTNLLICWTVQPNTPTNYATHATKSVICTETDTWCYLDAESDAHMYIFIESKLTCLYILGQHTYQTETFWH